MRGATLIPRRMLFSKTSLYGTIGSPIRRDKVFSLRTIRAPVATSAKKEERFLCHRLPIEAGIFQQSVEYSHRHE